MSLRMVEMVIPETAAADLESLAAKFRVLGLWREHLDGQQVLLRLLVSSEKSESVIAGLESQYSGHAGFRLVIFEVQATVPHPEATQEAAQNELDGATVASDTDHNAQPENPLRLACAELVQNLSSSAVINRVFTVTVILSTVVAAVGLVRDNVAVIIGAMVIAPLLGPNMVLALATTLGDLQLTRRALRVNCFGLALSLLISTLIGLLISVDPAVNEIATRTQVSLSDIVLALAAGSAGALALTTGLSAAIVGVMVAVALLPPVTATGLLVGSGDWELAAGSLLLTATNIVCINLAGVATFLWQRVGPWQWWRASQARRMVRIACGIWLALLGVLIGLILLARH